ncbi:MAG: glycosyltransferase family 4 protein, partial [Pseudomonadota bacterium]
GSDVPGYDATRASLRPLHGLLKPLLRQVWRRAAAVVALSGGLKTLARETAPQQPIEVVGNAIASDQFPAGKREFRRGSLRLICVCRLVKRKGLAHLLEAMQTLGRAGHRLELVGSGELMKDVRERVHELGVGAYVHLTGYVPRERLADYYNDADLFVLPSLSESFGQVLLEAMSCGLPIVATRVGGIPETITHGENGLLVDPGDAGELVVAVQALADDPAGRKRMAEHNALLARTVYRWETVAARYEDIYVKAIGERRSAAA